MTDYRTRLAALKAATRSWQGTGQGPEILIKHAEELAAWLDGTTDPQRGANVEPHRRLVPLHGSSDDSEPAATGDDLSRPALGQIQ